MKSIVEFPARSRFLVKLISCIAFGSDNFLWDKDNLINNHLWYHLLDKDQFFEYFHLFLCHFLIPDRDKKNSSINHKILVFHFYSWKIESFFFFLIVIFSISKTKSLFNPWKLWSIKRFNSDFVSPLILLIEICTGKSCVWILISIVPVAFYYLELIKLLLEHDVLHQLLQPISHLLN